MENKRVKKIKVGKTEINYFEIGSGKPLVSIVAGIHGDEKNSQLVIYKLMNKIKKINKGTLRIVPLANLLAVEEYYRENPEDDTDLNRIFPGSSGKTLSYKLALSLLNLVKDSDLVIDIHNYYTKIPLVNVYFKVGKEVDKKNKELHKILGSQVWVVNIEKERNFSGSLGGVLSKLSIPSLTIEIPKPEFSENKDIENCTNKLFNLMKYLEIVKGKAKKYPTKYYDRKVCVSSESGIFIPKVKLFSKIKKGQIMGVVRNLISEKEKILHSPISGKVLEILEESFVYPKREVCAIGKIIN